MMECHDHQYSEIAEERWEIVQREKEKEAEKKESVKTKDQSKGVQEQVT